MGLFSWLFGSRTKPIRRQPQAGRNLLIEALEDRVLMSCATISGYVYQDVNGNGLMDAGETGIANVPLQLKNSANVVVANATTNAQGYYEFAYDNTLSVAPATLTEQVTFGPQPTNWTLQGVLDQFDPTLGQLTSIEIIHAGSITSEIKVENTSPMSPSTITGTVGGTLTLTGPGINSPLTLSQNVGTLNASVYDGLTDFGGTSGISFGSKTANGSQTITLTGAAMNAFIGAGQVNLQESALATSQASGGGNLLVSIGSSGTATVTVKYHYIPSNCLQPGNYTIVETQQPAGFFDGKESKDGSVLPNSIGTDIIAVTLGQTNLVNNNFGELLPGKITGYVYHDLNNNGIKDPGEAGISGVQVSLSGTASLSTTTDANGFYQFLNLAPGTYTVTETQPANWVDGKDAAGSLGGQVANDVISNIILPGGGQSVNNNFGELQPGTLSGYVYNDVNNNGIKEAGEAGIQGVQVNLSGAANKTTTTDANGFYQFLNLTPGTYTVTETQPANWADGKDTAGTLGGQVSNDVISNINLPGNGQSLNNNFGELQPGNISGFVYHDLNNNGVKDPGEQGIQGVQVNLSGAANKTTTTDASGFYQFNNLLPGTYAVTETQPAGWLDAKESVGTLGGLAGNDVVSAINLTAAASSINNNFGEILPASLSGFVYVDANNNGIKDAGEQPIQGAIVALTGADDLGFVNKSATTNAQGFYEFTNLRPGTYALTETQPSGYMDGKDTIGSQGGQTSNDSFTNIALASGVNGINNNFGEVLSSSLSGYVFADANNNSIKDAGEQGIQGVQVNLTGTANGSPVNKTATTNAQGYYEFTNLQAGTYAISETQPSNWLDGKDAIGSQGGTTSNDQLANIVLPAGVNGINNNFGELAPASLTGFVYKDLNDNGIKEAGEAGIAGVTVTLTGFDDKGPVSLTSTTDASGAYTFSNLRPGTYALSETQPGNYDDGKDTLGNQGGTVSNDAFASILLGAGAIGANYNFGELVKLNADLGIVKTGPASVAPGATFTYTLSITNYGADAAANIVVVDNLPPELTYVGATGSGWTITKSGSVLTATRSSLAAGATATITVTVKAPIVSATMTNVTTVTSSTPDNNSTNNTSTVVTTVTSSPGGGFPKTVVPLATSFGSKPLTTIDSKSDLLGSSIGSTTTMSTAQAQLYTFVDGAYRTLLGHPVDQATINLQVQRLQSGLSREQLVREIWNSDEHRAYQVNQFYQVFLHRQPSAYELAWWITTLKQGMSEINAAVMFLTMSEYQQSHPTTSLMVTGFYQDILGRTPGSVELTAQVSALGVTTTASYAQSLLLSSEGLANLIDAGFRTILRRSASASEIAFWSNQISSGAVTPGEMMIKLTASTEFFNLAWNSAK